MNNYRVDPTMPPKPEPRRNQHDLAQRTAAAARLYRPVVNPSRNLRTRPGLPLETMAGPGAHELATMNAVQDDRVGETQVFTKPCRPSSWDCPWR